MVIATKTEWNPGIGPPVCVVFRSKIHIEAVLEDLVPRARLGDAKGTLDYCTISVEDMYMYM